MKVMKNSYNINIDTLKLCYTADAERLAWLAETEYFEGDEWRIMGVSCDKFCHFFNIDIRWANEGDEGMGWHHFGSIGIGDTFANGNDAAPYVWLTIANRMLYEPTTFNGTCMSFVGYIADCLGLRFNNITRLDIALDCDRKNLVGRVIKACKKYTTIVKGTAYKPQDKAGVMLLCSGPLKNLLEEKELIIKHTDGKCSLRVYNKTAEVEDSGKDYILASCKGCKDVWRTEISLNNKAVREYLENTGKEYDCLYNQIIANDKEVLADMFQSFLPRLIYWKADERIDLSIFDLPR